MSSVYQAHRRADGWVVIGPTGVVSQHGTGVLGAAAAKACAESLNSAPQRTPDHGLVAWRQRHALTQQRLAARLGVATFTLQRWESGEAKAPPMLTLALERLEQLL